MRKTLALASCCLLLLFLAALPAMADEWNKKTIVTFSQPVEIPGMVLPAGTYVFKLLNSSSNRNIVLVYNEAEDHLYKMILAINNYRLTPTDSPVLKFGEERTKGAPQPLRAWFWPSDNFGQEFVYPKVQARQLAEEVKEPVLSAEVTPAEKAEELIQEPVAAIAPEHFEIAEVTPAETPAPEPVAEAPAPEPAPVAAVEELPKTASEIPLLALLGAGSLALGGLLRRARAR